MVLSFIQFKIQNLNEAQIYTFPSQFQSSYGIVKLFFFFIFSFFFVYKQGIVKLRCMDDNKPHNWKPKPTLLSCHVLYINKDHLFRSMVAIKMKITPEQIAYMINYMHIIWLTEYIHLTSSWTQQPNRFYYENQNLLLSINS